MEFLRFKIRGPKENNIGQVGLKRRDFVELVYEPDNIYDGFAVAVHAEGKRIGYVPAELTSEVEDYTNFNVSELSIFDGEVVGCTLVGRKRPQDV